MAVVLVIMGLVIGGLLATAPAVLENQRYRDARHTLDLIEDALIGYTLANGGGLPSADVTGDGVSDPGSEQGAVPWKTLGLQAGLVKQDPWGKPYLYHVDSNWRDTPPPIPPDTVSGLRVDDLSGRRLTLDDPRAPVAVILTSGANGRPDGDNGDGDTRYTRNVYVDGTFDDEVRWISRYQLLGRLVDAGIWPQ
jgi:type II secretory pathway pseudopilin PulG